MVGLFNSIQCVYKFNNVCVCCKTYKELDEVLHRAGRLQDIYMESQFTSVDPATTSQHTIELPVAEQVER